MCAFQSPFECVNGSVLAYPRVCVCFTAGVLCVCVLRSRCVCVCFTAGVCVCVLHSRCASFPAVLSLGIHSTGTVVLSSKHTSLCILMLIWFSEYRYPLFNVLFYFIIDYLVLCRGGVYQNTMMCYVKKVRRQGHWGPVGCAEKEF